MSEYSKEEFMKHVEKDEATGCWNWKINSTSYMGRGFRQVAFIVFFGDTLGLTVGSTCKNKKCVCPDHIFLKKRTFFEYGETCNVGHLIDEKNGIFYKKENRYACGLCRAEKAINSGKTKRSTTLGVRTPMCKNGHEITGDDDLHFYGGKKTGTCKKCYVASKERYREKNREKLKAASKKRYLRLKEQKCK